MTAVICDDEQLMNSWADAGCLYRQCRSLTLNRSIEAIDPAVPLSVNCSSVRQPFVASDGGNAPMTNSPNSRHTSVQKSAYAPERGRMRDNCVSVHLFIKERREREKKRWRAETLRAVRDQGRRSECRFSRPTCSLASGLHADGLMLPPLSWSLAIVSRMAATNGSSGARATSGACASPTTTGRSSARSIATEPRGGGVKTDQGGCGLDRYPYHAGIFSTSGGISRSGRTVGSPLRAASRPDASRASTGRIAALRPATADQRQAAGRRYVATPQPAAAAINFPRAGRGR